MQKQYLVGPMTWQVTQRNAWSDIANLRTKQLSNYTKSQPPCIDDHHFQEEENESVGELSAVCSQIVVKCLDLARIGRLDILWSEQTCSCGHKMDKASDKQLARLIAYIHHTCEYRQYWYVGNTAQQCELVLFQDSDFAGDPED